MTCSHCNGRVMVFDDEAACIACGRSPAPPRTATTEDDPLGKRDWLTPGQRRRRARVAGVPS